jgi:hypothetical protein
VVVPVVEDLVVPVVLPVVEDLVEPVLPVVDTVVEPVLPVVEDLVVPVVLPVVENLVEPVIVLVVEDPAEPAVEGPAEPVEPVVNRDDGQPAAGEEPGSSCCAPPSPLDASAPSSDPPASPGGSPATGAGGRPPEKPSAEAPAASDSPGTAAAPPEADVSPAPAVGPALPDLAVPPEPVVARTVPGLRSERQQQVPRPAVRSSHAAGGATAASAFACNAAAAVYGPAPLSSALIEAVPDSASGGGSSEVPSLPSPSTCGGTGGGSGAASRTLFADLVTLAAFAAQPFSRRLRHASAPWPPAAFVALIERPG